jgi:pimeloyl-ACP methyl ester carboxylesterase
MVLLRTNEGEPSVPLAAKPGQLWKARLTSVCIPTQQVAQTIKTEILHVAFEAGGPRGGPPILLLHGWPDDPREWNSITAHIEKAGFHWVAPWVRGFGATRFLSPDTVRDGGAVALAQDAIDIADALGFEKFSVIGHDWGARTAYTLAALWPKRLSSITALSLSYSPGGRFPTPTFEQSQRWWYQKRMNDTCI